MSDIPTVVVTREDAVKTQLDAAIWLWFTGEEIGPIHALVDNALTILNDIGGKAGKESQFYSKATHQQVGRDRLKGFSNFLKHGSKDLNASYRFGILWTEGLALDAINLCAKIFPPVSLLMATFAARIFTVHYAENRLNREDVEKYLPKGVTLEEVVPLGRMKFLEAVLPLFAERGFRKG